MTCVYTLVSARGGLRSHDEALYIRKVTQGDTDTPEGLKLAGSFDSYSRRASVSPEGLPLAETAFSYAWNAQAIGRPLGISSLAPVSGKESEALGRLLHFPVLHALSIEYEPS